MAEQQPGVSSVTRPRSRRGGPGTAPQGSGPAYRLVPPQHTPGTAPQVCTLWRSAHGQVQSALSTCQVAPGVYQHLVLPVQISLLSLACWRCGCCAVVIWSVVSQCKLIAYRSHVWPCIVQNLARQHFSSAERLQPPPFSPQGPHPALSPPHTLTHEFGTAATVLSLLDGPSVVVTCAVAASQHQGGVTTAGDWVSTEGKQGAMGAGGAGRGAGARGPIGGVAPAGPGAPPHRQEGHALLA